MYFVMRMICAFCIFIMLFCIFSVFGSVAVFVSSYLSAIESIIHYHIDWVKLHQEDGPSM